MNAKEFAEELQNTIENAEESEDEFAYSNLHNIRVRTFFESVLLTNDTGLVIKCDEGEFHVTIVKVG